MQATPTSTIPPPHAALILSTEPIETNKEADTPLVEQVQVQMARDVGSPSGIYMSGQDPLPTSHPHKEGIGQEEESKGGDSVEEQHAVGGLLSDHEVKYPPKPTTSTGIVSTSENIPSVEEWEALVGEDPFEALRLRLSGQVPCGNTPSISTTSAGMDSATYIGVLLDEFRAHLLELEIF